MRVHRKALRKAVSIHGISAVAAALEQTPAQVQAWLEGRDVITDDVFLRIVDVLLEPGRMPHAGPPQWNHKKPR